MHTPISDAQGQDTRSAAFRCRWCPQKQHSLRPSDERLARSMLRLGVPWGPDRFLQLSGERQRKLGESVSAYPNAGNRTVHHPILGPRKTGVLRGKIL